MRHVLFRADTVLRAVWFGRKVKMQPNILKDIMSANPREVWSDCSERPVQDKDEKAADQAIAPVPALGESGGKAVAEHR
jgi:hypothetical protein